MAIRSKIGSRIRDLRKAQRPELSVNRLATLAEVDPGQLSRAERGLAGLSIEALIRIANALNTSLADLVEPVDPRGNGQAGKGGFAITHDEYDYLVGRLTDHVINTMCCTDLETCSGAKRELIRHHIRSAIEAGVKRAYVQAEYEVEQLCDGREDRF